MLSEASGTQRVYCGFVRCAATVLTVVLIVVPIGACSSTPVRPDNSAAGRGPSSVLSLSCADSVGQQGPGHATVVGGVTGLVLPGSDDTAGLYPVRAGDGKRYFVYKALLAVSAAAAPYAMVSITRPAGVTLVYGPSALTSSGPALVAASRRRVRLPVCGPRFTGFVGGVIVTGAACVTFRVSSPSAKPQTVSVPVGPAQCRQDRPPVTDSTTGTAQELASLRDTADM
jgi:hypothetical protein